MQCDCRDYNKSPPVVHQLTCMAPCPTDSALVMGPVASQCVYAVLCEGCSCFSVWCVCMCVSMFVL